MFVCFFLFTTVKSNIETNIWQTDGPTSLYNLRRCLLVYCKVTLALKRTVVLMHRTRPNPISSPGPVGGRAEALTFRPASLLCRFMSVLAFCLISRASTKTLANPIPYLMSAEQPPHFHPSSLWYCPCFSLSQPQSLRLPCVQAAVMACATPAAMMAYVNAASLLPAIKTVP